MARILHFIIFVGAILSAGCASLEPLLASLTPPSPVPTSTALSRPTPTQLPNGTAAIAPKTSSLRLWLPAQFDPSAENPAAEMLSQRLSEFESQHGELKIEVRL